MKTLTSLIACLLLLLLTVPSQARRTHLTDEQQSKLARVQTILVQVLALTEKGPRPSTPITEVIQRRLEEIGFTVVTDRSKPFDVEVKVKCEERKTWTGTTPAGGDAELPDAPSRLWKGPACLLTYHLDGRDLQWYKEVRTDFEDALAAARASQAGAPGDFALSKLQQRLEEYDFPVLLAAEWGQVDRLLDLLESPTTHTIRKLKILSALSELHAEQALPRLTKVMKDKALQQEAIVALAGTGQESIPLLIDLFETAQQSAIRAAAAKALGELAAKTGDPRIIPPLIRYVRSVLPNLKSHEDIDFPVLTEVVWSMGKLRDEYSLEPIAKLQQKIWLIFDKSPEMEKLREATNWTYKQLDLDGHLS